MAMLNNQRVIYFIKHVPYWHIQKGMYHTGGFTSANISLANQVAWHRRSQKPTQVWCPFQRDSKPKETYNMTAPECKPKHQTYISVSKPCTVPLRFTSKSLGFCWMFIPLKMVLINSYWSIAIYQTSYQWVFPSGTSPVFIGVQHSSTKNPWRQEQPPGPGPAYRRCLGHDHRLHSREGQHHHPLPGGVVASSTNFMGKILYSWGYYIWYYGIFNDIHVCVYIYILVYEI